MVSFVMSFVGSGKIIEQISELCLEMINQKKNVLRIEKKIVLKYSFFLFVWDLHFIR